MERRRLGTTDLQLTPVGVGTAPIGSGRDWPVWWGSQDDLASLDADDFRRRHPFAQLALDPLRETLRAFERHDRSAAQVALAWVLHHPAVAGAIVGIRNEPEAEQLPGVADLQLDPDELRKIESAAP